MKPGPHIACVDKLLKRLCKEAGINDSRLHDIRRFVGCSVLAKTGTLEMVPACLNHTSLHTSRVYASYNREQVRDSLERPLRGEMAKQMTGRLDWSVGEGFCRKSMRFYNDLHPCS